MFLSAIKRFFVKIFRRLYILFKMAEVIDSLNNRLNDDIFNMNVEDIDSLNGQESEKN